MQSTHYIVMYAENVLALDLLQHTFLCSSTAKSIILHLTKAPEFWIRKNENIIY